MSADQTSAYIHALDRVGEISASTRARFYWKSDEITDIESERGKALDMIRLLLPFVTREELEGAMKDADFWGES